MVLPLIFAGFLLSIFLAVCIFKCIRYYGHCSGKRPKYFSHANKLVSMFVIIFYFVYLTVTRRALDIFNCNPPDPPDGYMYTEFTSIDCAGGTCVCDDPNSLQAQLKPYAVLSFIVYSLGFPLFVGWMTWFYRIQIKLDQLLRAHDLGETRQEAIENMRFTPRRCRSKTRHTYDLRKKFHKLYYHFKPGKVYWMLVILTRKLLVALFALLFRRNVAFLLSCVLLVLFASYVLQVRNKPYMSQVERDDVKYHHRLKVAEAKKLRTDNPMIELPGDLRLHLEMSEAVTLLQSEIDKRKSSKGFKAIRSLSHAARHVENKEQPKTAADYYFDYNTVEQVLIMCSIFLSLVAIMFESGQFYVLDPDTGISKLSEDPTNKAFYNTVLSLGSVALIGSLIYYGIVFTAEVLGHVPSWVRKMFASKKSLSKKRTDSKAAGLGDDDGSDVIEMANIDNLSFRNPLNDLEAAKGREQQAMKRARDAEKKLEAEAKSKDDLLQQVKRLRKKNAEQQLGGSQSRVQRKKRVLRKQKKGRAAAASKMASQRFIRAESVGGAAGKTSGAEA